MSNAVDIKPTEGLVRTCNGCGSVNDETNKDCAYNLCRYCCYTTGLMAFCSFHLPRMESCPCCLKANVHQCTDGKNCDDCDGTICCACCNEGFGICKPSNVIAYTIPDP